MARSGSSGLPSASATLVTTAAPSALFTGLVRNRCFNKNNAECNHWNKLINGGDEKEIRSG